MCLFRLKGLKCISLGTAVLRGVVGAPERWGPLPLRLPARLRKPRFGGLGGAGSRLLPAGSLAAGAGACFPPLLFLHRARCGVWESGVEPPGGIWCPRPRRYWLHPTIRPLGFSPRLLEDRAAVARSGGGHLMWWAGPPSSTCLLPCCTGRRCRGPCHSSSWVAGALAVIF